MTNKNDTSYDLRRGDVKPEIVDLGDSGDVRADTAPYLGRAPAQTDTEGRQSNAIRVVELQGLLDAERLKSTKLDKENGELRGRVAKLEELLANLKVLLAQGRAKALEAKSAEIARLSAMEKKEE